MRATVLAKLDCARAALLFCDRHPGWNEAITATTERLRHWLVQAERMRLQQLAALEEMERAGWERQELARAFKERVQPLLQLAVTVAQVREVPELRLRHLGKVEAPGNFLRAARQSLAAAQRHRAMLQEAGMPPAMLPALLRDYQALRTAHHRRRTSLEVHAAATADTERAGREAMRLVRHLDALFRIRFLAAPEVLAEWQMVLGRGREGSARSVA